LISKAFISFWFEQSPTHLFYLPNLLLKMILAAIHGYFEILDRVVCMTLWLSFTIL